MKSPDKYLDPLPLAQALIKCASVTPKDAGVMDTLETALEALGFQCWRLPFSENGTPDVDNLFARLGTGSPHFCFAGHVDVVPEGEVSKWSHPPFEADISNKYLFGRGAVDMKGAIAAFVAAVARYQENIIGQSPNGSISLLITGDEEGPSVNGTRKVLKWMNQNAQKPDGCLVGEPTNPMNLGDMIKIGRRGSLNAILTVNGSQGHAAYPHLAENPIPFLVSMLDWLNSIVLDTGTDYFQPSNIEITSVDVGNSATNVIPESAKAMFNIRFNNLHSSENLIKKLKIGFSNVSKNYTLETICTGDAFLTEPGELSNILSKSIQDITGQKPELSTSGGTSDARFIKDLCPVVEFGLTGKTMHKIDECVSLNDLELLTEIYLHTLTKFINK
ncbi:MAG: succinyl-diaminopimelate desuccinylase [Gammaproteobacteria bacterium]|nr:succinyl-diaminopimelate desuccinylase [Gammaproteobacteria bacterium]